MTNKGISEEMSRISKLIEQELEEAWADPGLKAYFDKRVRQEEKSRELSELEHQRKELDKEYKSLQASIVRLLPSAPTFEKELENLSKVTQRFQEGQNQPPTYFGIAQVLDVNWQAQCDEFVSNLKSIKKAASKEVSRKIEEGVTGLVRTLEDNFQKQFESYVENKLKQKVEEKKKELTHLIDDPIKSASERIFKSAKMVDVAQDSTVSSIYKIANFLNKGEFDVSYAQKMSILMRNFKAYCENHESFSKTESVEGLCRAIKESMETGDFEKIPELMEKFAKSEETKMTDALVELEKALDKAAEKEGEQFVEDLLTNAEKELERKFLPYKIAKNIGSTAKRIEPFLSVFGGVGPVLPKEVSSPPVPAKPKQKNQPSQEKGKPKPKSK